jgi:transcriptional regulator with GAF, ATPase, and Fis domain
MNYTVMRRVGSGTFGAVYEARDQTGRRYAAKIVETDDPVARNLLEGQFRLLSGLNHKRIMAPVDFDLHSPRGPTLVTELVDGVDLKAFVEARGGEHLPTIAFKVLDALRYLHARGKLHGDLKPDSIVVFDEGDGPEIKLIDAGFDFGEASRLPTLAGTLPYLAPEIIRNLPADGRSDLYSLGVTLYEALTGTCPFGGSTAEEILIQHLELIPPEPTSVKPAIAAQWDAFIGGLVKKEPFARYRDATHAALELGKLFGRPAEAAAHLLPPSDTGLLGMEDDAGRVRDFATGRSSSRVAGPLVVCGEQGSGVGRLLAVAEAAGKSSGRKVSRVYLKPGMPALAQLLEALRASAARTDAAIGKTEVDAGPDPSAAYAEIIETLKCDSQARRRHLVIVDGCEAMDADELEILGRTAGLVGDHTRMVLGYRAASSQLGVCPGTADADRVDIKPLSAESLEDVLKGHFAVLALPEGLTDEMHRATRGNRGALDVALAQLWRAHGLAYAVEGGSIGLTWDRAVRNASSPREVLEEKLARVSPLGVEVVGLVCASGGKLAVEAVHEFCLPRDCTGALEETVREGLVEEIDGKASLRLLAEGLSQVILDALTPGWIKGASLRLAAIVEHGLKNESERYGLGLLYLQAGSPTKACDALSRAGDYFSRFSPGDAVLAYSEALKCAPDGARLALLAEKIGDVRLARGDLNGALAAFDQGAAIRPVARRKLGWVRGLRGDTGSAVQILSECEKDAAAAGDLAERARVLSDLGYIYSLQGKRELALELLGRAKAFFEQAGLGLEAGLAANRVAITVMRTGNTVAAAAAWQEARVHFERAGARRQVGLSLMALGTCSWKQMDFARALELLDEALAAFEATKSLACKASCLQNRAVVLVDTGDLALARQLAQEALELHMLLGDLPGVVPTRLLMATIELEAGNAEDARRNLAEVASHDLNAYTRSLLKLRLAMVQALVGDSEGALALADESHKLASEAGDADGEGRAMLARSEILLRSGRYPEALETGCQALATFRVSASTLLANVADRVVGEALCLSGRIEEGTARLLAAKQSLASAGESLHLGRVHRALAAAGFLGNDFDSFETQFRLAAELFRTRGARHDYAQTLLLAGKAWGRRSNFIKARNYLAEAGRVFGTLGSIDLHRQVVKEMERMIPDETEITAVASLSRISQTLNSSYDLTTVLNLAMDLAMEYLGAERGVLLLEDEGPGRPTTIVERRMDKESVEEVITISRSIVETVRATRQPVIARDATVDPRFKNSKSVRIHNVMSVMCVPLMRKQSLLGLIYLDNRDVPSDFSSLDRAFVDAFANQVALAIENARNVGRLYEDVADLRARAGQKHSFANIIGPGEPMQEVFRQVEKAAPSSISVLLTGESGTGKELIAGLLHELSPRRDRPLVRVNCAAIHRELIEAELFGIEKHVATGVAPRSGFFERADGGTVFLDEIGDMPLTTQTKVLRVLAEKQFERVGGAKVLKVDVRLISATNQDLKQLIEKGLFRKDLYFRLNAMLIHLPPLRERLSDLPVLADHFIVKYTAENSKPPMKITPRALHLLSRYGWPGNVRELERCIEHAVVVADGPELRPEHFPKDILDSLASEGPLAAMAYRRGRLPDLVRQFERDLIRHALKEANGVKVGAARILKIHESTLRKKMKDLGIDNPA